MRDQFNSIPIELDEAAFVDGLSTWGTFARIVLPLSVPGMAAAFILLLVLCWNEYFFAALLTSTDAKPCLSSWQAKLARTESTGDQWRRCRRRPSPRSLSSGYFLNAISSVV